MSVKEIEYSMQKKQLGGSLSMKKGSLRAPTVFDHLVHSDLPPEELTVERLASEAQVLLGAGTVTTAQSLNHLVVHILLHSRVETRLRQELAAATYASTTGSWPPLRELEKLPYLQACIKEGLRYAASFHSSLLSNPSTVSAMVWSTDYHESHPMKI